MGNQRQQFEDLFLPFLNAAYNLARWIVHDEQDTQDVVQEAYLRAFKGFHGFRGGKERAWLLTIVRNTAYTCLSKRGADEKLVPYEEEKHADIIALDRPATDMASEQRKEELRSALQRLPAEFREIIVLYEFEGLSYKELASALGVPIGTVMSRLSRARRRLQKEFAHGQGGEAINEL
jgi:RNA polymerase sigma-70 factor (ECF subfamily)